VGDARPNIFGWDFRYVPCVVNGAIGVSPGNTTERNTIEESLGDYFAGSYSLALNGFNFNKIFNWDGHNEFWNGREGGSLKDYQNISFGGDIYEHTDIFTSCLLYMNTILGRNVADELVLEAIYNLTPGTTMPQFAWDVIRADSSLYGGQNFFDIYNSFVPRNILPVWVSLPEGKTVNQNNIYISGSYNFARGYDLSIYSLESPVKNLQLLSADGKQVKVTPTILSESEIKLNGAGLKAGFYILQLSCEDGTSKSFKLTRF